MANLAGAELDPDTPAIGYRVALFYAGPQAADFSDTLHYHHEGLQLLHRWVANVLPGTALQLAGPLQCRFFYRAGPERRAGVHADARLTDYAAPLAIPA